MRITEKEKTTRGNGNRRKVLKVPDEDWINALIQAGPEIPFPAGAQKPPWPNGNGKESISKAVVFEAEPVIK